ncbi:MULTISPECIES: FkbM family methyltransferase [Hyphobacterium]|uniref:FkbM family methyltransferase n=1 Tax=Hyphobacterium vulgare TaxID=1736751 RepID=A0ABV6ZVK8_9PROT
MQTDLIFDFGMHVGQDTAFYLKKGFRVVAVEANPALAERARLRFARAVAQGRLVIEARGVAASAGEADFHVNTADTAWSSFHAEIGGRGAGASLVRVPTVTAIELFQTHGVPYFMKIDIEGSDHLPLQALRKTSDRPRYVSVENGGPELRALLCELGYDRFKWVNQRDVPRQRLPFPAREGRWTFHRFAYGASGAFGEEAPGPWLALSEVEAVIDAHGAGEDFDASRDGWGDLHARLGAG